MVNIVTCLLITNSKNKNTCNHPTPLSSSICNASSTIDEVHYRRGLPLIPEWTDKSKHVSACMRVLCVCVCVCVCERERERLGSFKRTWKHIIPFKFNNRKVKLKIHYVQIILHHLEWLKIKFVHFFLPLHQVGTKWLTKNKKLVSVFVSIYIMTKYLDQKICMPHTIDQATCYFQMSILLYSI